MARTRGPRYLAVVVASALVVTTTVLTSRGFAGLPSASSHTARSPVAATATPESAADSGWQLQEEDEDYVDDAEAAIEDDAEDEESDTFLACGDDLVVFNFEKECKPVMACASLMGSNAYVSYRGSCNHPDREYPMLCGDCPRNDDY